MPSRRTERPSPVIAITLGDPAGIGPEIVAKTLCDPRLPKGFKFELVGQKTDHLITLGKSTRASARAALSALEEAADGCLEGRFAAMVTAPIQKETIAAIHPGFIGQTEFLARACDLADEAAVMVLTDPKLTVALCSNHCSLSDAVKRLTPKRIVYVTTIMRNFLQRRGIAQPRVAFASVNPHGGEGGLFGDHDQRIVTPACEKLHRHGIVLEPGPADTIFYRAVQQKAFDAVICAYHDQGLIPFKLVAFATGVNVTLGLPIIRTSPDHGTALALAGHDKADHRSMLAAVRLACQLVQAKKAPR